MAAKKARKTKKGTQRKFVPAVKAGTHRKSAKKKAVKRPARKAAKKRNSKTIIKAKRVTILNLKKNPAYAIHKTLKAAKRGNQTGWLLGTKFYAKTRGQKALPGGSVLDLNSGLVYQRVENPKSDLDSRLKALSHRVLTAVDAAYESRGSSETNAIVKRHGIARRYLYEGKSSDELKLRASLNSLLGALSRKKNIQMMAGGHPIRASADYDPARAGESPSRKSSAAQKAKRRATQKKIKAAGGVKKFVRKIKTRKAATRKARSTRSMTAATKQRKATTTRLASRSLDRSGPKKTRRNPSVEQKLQEWRGTPKDRDSTLNAPDGTPSPLYQLGPLQYLKVEGYSAKDFRIEKPGVIWVCADAKGKIHLATKTNVPMTNLPAGPIGKVARIDYGPVHKTQFYDGPEEFKHNFGEENGKRPTLYSDGKGGLLLKGGDYYITYRGIQN